MSITAIVLVLFGAIILVLLVKPMRETWSQHRRIVEGYQKTLETNEE